MSTATPVSLPEIQFANHTHATKDHSIECSTSIVVVAVAPGRSLNDTLTVVTEPGGMPGIPGPLGGQWFVSRSFATVAASGR